MITTRHSFQDAPSRDLIVIRALSSITPEQAEAITQAVRSTAPDWDIQTMVDYDGYLSILVTPSTDARSGDVSFLISGTKGNLELCEVHGDDMARIAAFSDVEDLSVELESLLGPVNAG